MSKGEGLTLLWPVLPLACTRFLLGEDHKVQVNTLYIRRDGISILGTDRHGLYPWHMQQQRSSLVPALASNGQLDLVLLCLTELVHPCTADLYLEGCGSPVRVHRCLSDTRLKISDQAVAIP